MDCSFLENALVGEKVRRPTGGTLSGHAAGEPFDKCVENLLKEQYPERALRQYEYLNKLYASRKRATSTDLRHALIKNRVARFLLSRGDSATQRWSEAQPFSEKQDDTADILLLNRKDVINANKFCLVDVKTHNNKISGQGPNIISAYKLAQTCKLILEENQEDSGISFTYVGIDWIESGQRKLECRAAYVRSLFKADPDFYINWAAAMQVQFHVSKLAQDYSGDVREWSKDFLNHYVKSAKKRISHMKKELIAPFEQS